MGRKMLIGSDPLLELWGSDITKPQYRLLLSTISSTAFFNDITEIIFCSPYDGLYDLVVSEFESSNRFGDVTQIERRSKNDSFDDIYLAFLFIHDDMMDSIVRARNLGDRLPESDHIMHHAMVWYKYTWQIDAVIDKIYPDKGTLVCGSSTSMREPGLFFSNLCRNKKGRK